MFKRQIARNVFSAIATCALLMSSTVPSVQACTGIRLIAEDGTVVQSASDLKAKRFYFRTYENSQIRMVDLMKMDVDSKDIVKISIKGDEVINPLTP